MDQTPLTADLIGLTSALDPVSPAIAAGCFAVLGAALVLVALGIRLQWLGSGVRPWLAVVVVGLLLAGFAVTTVADVRSVSIATISSTAYGQPAAPVPATLTGSWPSIAVAARTMEALGAGTIVALVVSARVRRRRRGDARRSPTVFDGRTPACVTGASPSSVGSD